MCLRISCTSMCAYCVKYVTVHVCSLVRDCHDLQIIKEAVFSVNVVNGAG